MENVSVKFQCSTCIIFLLKTISNSEACPEKQHNIQNSVVPNCLRLLRCFISYLKIW